MKAACLKPGGVIGICSPSHPAPYDEFQAVIRGIRDRGYRVLEAEHLYGASGGCPAPPEARAEDFNRLVGDEGVELIFFGGGEGGNELLPYLDFESISRHPKRICSYSDGTTLLNAVWARTGVETYYGQTPYLFTNISSYDYRNFCGHLVQGDMSRLVPNSRWRVQSRGRAVGTLIGGYTRNFAMLMGNRYFPIDPRDSYILFLEDYEAFSGVRFVSAMLSHIEQYEFAAQIAGLVFGHYSLTPHPELLDRLKLFGERHHIPVIYCDDFGHGANHAILPIGRPALLDTDCGVLQYL